MIEKIPIQVKEIVNSIDMNALVFLFGSRARGDFRANSDWDFLIITEQEATSELQDRIRAQLYELELETDQVISSVIESREEWAKYVNSEFYKNILNEGIKVNLPEAA